MNKEQKRRLFKPQRWNLYENGIFIDSFESHTKAKTAKYFKSREARKNWLDLEYTLKRVN